MGTQRGMDRWVGPLVVTKVLWGRGAGAYGFPAVSARTSKEDSAPVVGCLSSGLGMCGAQVWGTRSFMKGKATRVGHV